MTEDLLYIPDFLRSTKGKQKNMSITTTKKELCLPTPPYGKKPPKRRALVGLVDVKYILRMRCYGQVLDIGYYGLRELESGHTSQICMEHLVRC